jgi:hypothetical protein
MSILAHITLISLLSTDHLFVHLTPRLKLLIQQLDLLKISAQKAFKQPGNCLVVA